MTRRCYIFDLDGTLADLSHRLHLIQKDPKDWDAFFDACEDDTPIEHMCRLAYRLGLYDGIVIASGRSSRVRLKTENWFRRTNTFYDALYMRADGDHRPDDVVKLELLERIRAEGWDPIMAFEDRDRVVAMWRNAGIPCAQVAAGDF